MKNNIVELKSLTAWLKMLSLLIPLAGMAGFGAVKLLGVETQEDHDADIDSIEAILFNQTKMLQCLLWDVPAVKCLASYE